MGVYIHGLTLTEFLRILNNGEGEFKYTEVKEPHGRLIDVDHFMEKVFMAMTMEEKFPPLDVVLESTPTVIESEGE